ncbi:YSIRK-type signal peptide-containing protein [Lactobacillus amylolyticus]|uniref:Gram-positive signal peptide protein, YSIRK family n=1 Tax=Lactobacillus amylolyticus DSM 11664 TaxID=585524 RepID=D4YRV0_9LACO|nr:YSIRK-type signal peptide-containing protein [Lactobacillus amylolyticus]EFG56180.1 Gram-positive signal peptide protein, YSIRK family [Lactobacillus amylolyticus DSM 11664]KRL18422.1 triacylglycerol lipase [Lactobacillus amylolyticus DSM 11664]QFY03943.1 YSIRK-type signal peptide-containing protein [Lactobacillus amylolyticus]TDG61490.1 hypothetical protein C5L18_000312 [Lactobacillus amylolyticus]
MLSKKNPQLKLNQEAERRSRFSIRKLSIGAASVMIGCFLYLGGNSAVASADEAPADQGDLSAITTKPYAVLFQVFQKTLPAKIKTKKP